PTAGNVLCDPLVPVQQVRVLRRLGPMKDVTALALDVAGARVERRAGPLGHESGRARADLLFKCRTHSITPASRRDAISSSSRPAELRSCAVSDCDGETAS